MTWRYPDKPTTAAPAFLQTLEPCRWIVQAKMDGWRCVITKTADGLTFTSRHRQEIPASAEVREQARAALAGLAPGSIVDAEWMGRRCGAPESLVYFDLIHDGSAWLGQLSAMERFRRLHASVVRQPLVQPVAWSDADYAEFFEESRNDPAWEGVVLKRVDSKYIGSVRGCVDNPAWFKVRYRGGADGQAAVG